MGEKTHDKLDILTEIARSTDIKFALQDHKINSLIEQRN